MTLASPTSVNDSRPSGGLTGTYAVRRPVENVYLVRQRDRRRLLELALVLAATLLVAVGLLSYVWINVQLLDVGYRVHRLEQRLFEAEEVERQLLVETSYLASPQQVEKRAAEELGMKPAGLDQLIFAEEIP